VAEMIDALFVDAVTLRALWADGRIGGAAAEVQAWERARYLG